MSLFVGVVPPYGYHLSICCGVSVHDRRARFLHIRVFLALIILGVGVPLLVVVAEGRVLRRRRLEGLRPAAVPGEERAAGRRRRAGSTRREGVRLRRHANLRWASRAADDDSDRPHSRACWPCRSTNGVERRMACRLPSPAASRNAAELDRNSIGPRGERPNRGFIPPLLECRVGLFHSWKETRVAHGDAWCAYVKCVSAMTLAYTFLVLSRPS